jgi:hypothetical protein
LRALALKVTPRIDPKIARAFNRSKTDAAEHESHHAGHFEESVATNIHFIRFVAASIAVERITVITGQFSVIYSHTMNG